MNRLFAQVLPLAVLNLAVLEGEAHEPGELLLSDLVDERFDERGLDVEALDVDCAQQVPPGRRDLIVVLPMSATDRSDQALVVLLGD